MWAWNTPRRRVTPEAGYNLEAHHTGGKPVEQAHHTGGKPVEHKTCGGKEYRNVAYRDRIPQCPTEAKNTAMWPAEIGYHNIACGGENTAIKQTSLLSNDLTLQLRKFLPS